MHNAENWLHSFFWGSQLPRYFFSTPFLLSPLIKPPSSNTARFLKCVWPFFIIMHERVKVSTSASIPWDYSRMWLIWFRLSKVECVWPFYGVWRLKGYRKHSADMQTKSIIDSFLYDREVIFSYMTIMI